MGLLDFLKSKKKNAELTAHTFHRENENSNENTKPSVKGLTIHEDLVGLVWIADGKYKNYEQSQKTESSIETDYGSIKISMSGDEEPSLIYTNQEINAPKNIEEIASPSYYPTYSVLTPEQKWVYLNFLSNPYNTSIDIGFVFILYYGLERHLLSGNFEKATEIILKLRDVHTNGSFQAYSADAVILSCMFHKRSDLTMKFIKSLDKEHELNFDHNLFLICYFSYDFPLSPKDIMRMCKTFEFDNINYIKKYPDIFLENLKNVIKNKLGVETVDLKNYLTPSEIQKKIRHEEVKIFANTSINKSISIPMLCDSFKLKKEMFDFLTTAHEDVKKKLAEMRKAGISVTPQKPPTKKKKELIFDEGEENFLLFKLSINKNRLVNRHFAYISLQNFYYKYRELDEKYIDKCIEFCILDINSLPELAEDWRSSEIHRLSDYLHIIKECGLSSDIKEVEDEIEEIKQGGFIGNITAFKRLAIIYEKQEKFDKAIEVCESSIAYGQDVEYFEDKKQKIQKKKNG